MAETNRRKQNQTNSCRPFSQFSNVVLVAVNIDAITGYRQGRRMVCHTSAKVVVAKERRGRRDKEGEDKRKTMPGGDARTVIGNLIGLFFSVFSSPCK